MVKRKLKFASNIVYEACKGYAYNFDLNHAYQSEPVGGVTLEQDHVTATSGPIPSDNVNMGQANVSGNLGPRRDLHGLEEVVDDIAARFWKCRRCLSMHHDIEACTNQIRCRGCFRYGHKENSCFNKSGKEYLQWVPKRASSTTSSPSGSDSVPPAISPPFPQIDPTRPANIASSPIVADPPSL
jgi:hypothetical protein